MPQSPVTETWVFFAIGVSVIILRFYARWTMIRFRFQGDDYFAALALFFIILNAIAIQLASPYFNTLTDATQVFTLPPSKIAELETPLKWIYITLFTFAGEVYSFKGCAIFLYSRITLGLWQRKLVMWNGILAIFVLIGTCLAFIVPCIPFQERLRVIPPSGAVGKCPYFPNGLYIFTAGNVLTDFVLLVIGVNLVWKLQLPLGKKLLIGAILASGSMGILAAIIRAALAGKVDAAANTLLANIEMLTVNIAVNAPTIRPLISDSKWLSSGRNGASGTYRGYELEGSSRLQSTRRSMAGKILQSRTKPANSQTNSESEIGIVRGDEWGSGNGGNGRERDGARSGLGNADSKSPFEIHTTTTYDVSARDVRRRGDGDSGDEGLVEPRTTAWAVANDA